MSNPYAPPADCETPGASPSHSFSKAPFVAYGVHHFASVAGWYAACGLMPSVWKNHFPADHPWEGLLMVVMVPLADFYLLIEPLAAVENVPSTYIYIALLVLRWILVLTLPVGMLMYAKTRRRALLWYLGNVSFVVFFSLVVSIADYQRPLGAS